MKRLDVLVPFIIGLVIAENYSHLPQVHMAIFLLGIWAAGYMFYVGFFADKVKVDRAILKLKLKGKIVSDSQYRFFMLQGSFALFILMFMMVN